MSGFIETKIENKIARVTLNRPEVHNAFNDEMILELTKIFNELSTNNAVRVVILESNGKSFSAGADLNWMKSMIDFSFEENKADAERLAIMLRSIAECSKPVIGRVQGASFGGGVGLTAACDMVVASKDAFFSLSEVRLGLIPAVISPFVLKKMPVNQALRFFMTGERFSVEKAYEIGLVAEIAEDLNGTEEVISKWINEIFKNGPEAVSLAKQLVLDSHKMDIDEAIDYSTRVIAERRVSTEGQEGMKSFLEKRKANWIEE